MKSALLVIEVQRGLCEGKYATFDADGVIQRDAEGEPGRIPRMRR